MNYVLLRRLLIPGIVLILAGTPLRRFLLCPQIEQDKDYSLQEARGVLDALDEAEKPNVFEAIAVLHQAIEKNFVEAKPETLQIVEAFKGRGPNQDFVCWHAMLAAYMLDEDNAYLHDWAERFNEYPTVAGYALMLWSVHRSSDAALFIDQVWEKSTDPYWVESMQAVVLLRAAQEAYAQADADGGLRMLFEWTGAGVSYDEGSGNPYEVFAGGEPRAIWAREQLALLSKSDPERIAKAYDAFDIRWLSFASVFDDKNPRDVERANYLTKRMKSYLLRFLPENVKALIH